ncbi:hypothetical protein L7F22_035731 [Adiantum nelumboides]|nr:hypothetical protein [Adiantum nelumboides]
MSEEMERDPAVFLMGEDIVKQGGIFGQFAGLAERFGTQRRLPHLRDGRAGEPGGEAALHVRRAGKGPARRAGPGGGRPVGRGTALPEPGSVVLPQPRVAGREPGHPEDAKGLLKAAIRCDDPVLFLEHKGLYSTRGEVADAPDLVSVLGEARVVRPGTDVTVVSWSRTLTTVLDAVKQVGPDGPDVEVIDLRTLAPWDVDTVVRSVRRTGRLVVVHEAVRTCGLGAEIVATVAEQAHDALRRAPVRIANPDLPIPFAPPLERAVLPQVEQIGAALAEVAA